jgi:2-desacetyl-2-hydroxyethyl bacteriochlorophyllide A dehydrogenase
MTATALWFLSERQAGLLPAEARDPGPRDVTIRAVHSLVSAGTEMLVYRGRTGENDLKPPNVVGRFTFPIKYGYQVVGVVEKAGAEAGFSEGQRVFVRHPHQDRFTTATESTWVTPLPDDLSDVAGTFLNLARVALTANLDVPVKAGEVAVVFGQGVVGALCARIARRNAGKLVVVDPIAARRDLALASGADLAVAPEDAEEAVASVSGGRGADVAFEASGAGSALQSSFRVTAEYGTIAVLSYFGATPVPLVLAPDFHWKRQTIVSSNAGTRPRWDPVRRTEATLDLLPSLDTPSLVSRHVPFVDGPDAYRIVDEHPDQVLGVVIDY